MRTDLRFNASLTSLAAASLCISTAANAGAAPTPVSNGLTTAPAVAGPNFPKSLTVDGKRYDRLTGASLDHAVRGKTFCPSPPCSGIDGSVELFRNDGAYLVFEDRRDGGGRYAIVCDLVITTLGDERGTYALYRSTDGTVQRAFKDRSGIIRLMKEFIK